VDTRCNAAEPVDLVARGYQLGGTASASPCGKLPISQSLPPARVPDVAQPPSAVRPTGLKIPQNARMAAVWAMRPPLGQGPAWTRRWSLPAPQPLGDSGPSTAHRAAVPHCSRRYGYYQVVGNWRSLMSKSTGPVARAARTDRAASSSEPRRLGQDAQATAWRLIALGRALPLGMRHARYCKGRLI